MINRGVISCFCGIQIDFFKKQIAPRTKAEIKTLLAAIVKGSKQVTANFISKKPMPHKKAIQNIYKKFFN